MIDISWEKITFWFGAFITWLGQFLTIPFAFKVASAILGLLFMWYGVQTRKKRDRIAEIDLILKEEELKNMHK